MVPLKLDLCDDRPETLSRRPQLVLKDLTQERTRPMRRSPRLRIENILLAAAGTAAVLFLLFSTAASLLHSVQQSYASQILPQAVVISKTVAHGDTLAGLAYRYGDPNTYILEREDQIARVNHLLGTAPLLPGQHLQIPVTNPTVIAQIVRSSHRHLVASR